MLTDDMLLQHEDDGAEAATRVPAAPTSFESELVLTLDDLATRLNTLARVLSAYWGSSAGDPALSRA